jgi:hypothetical protein
MYDPTLPFPPVPSQASPQKQSRIGITAFVLGILSALFLCIGFIISIGYGVSLGLNNPSMIDPASLVDQTSPAIIASSVFIYCTPVISLIGVGLGIAAVVQKKDKKTLGTIGLILNALMLLGVCVLLTLGLVMTAGTLAP